MTTTTPSSRTSPRAVSGTDVPSDASSGWVAWNQFAGVLMIVLGCLGALQGLVAVFNDEWVVWTNQGSVLVDLTVWGWVHVALAAVVVLAGLGILAGNAIARAVGVLVACFSIAANFAFLPVYPLWSLTIIALDVVLVWALIVHGAELRELPS